MSLDANACKPIAKVRSIAADFRHAETYVAEGADDKKLAIILKNAGTTTTPRRGGPGRHRGRCLRPVPRLCQRRYTPLHTGVQRRSHFSSAGTENMQI
jgi:hypothetical protein